MKWLIAEDALRDRKGHWFEYIQTFVQGLSELNDEVTVWSDRKAEPFVTDELESVPLLPESIWHRMSDDASRITRYARVPLHAAATYRCVSRGLHSSPQFDVIFVPTVMVHHLLGWYWLLKVGRIPVGTTVLFFFPNLPITLDRGGIPKWIDSPTTKLLAFLLRGLLPLIRNRRVVLGVETHEMQQAFQTLSGCEVVYLPHPVSERHCSPPGPAHQPLAACYGAARHEKGSDIFQKAILHILQHCSQPAARFAIQWLEDFEDTEGQKVQLSDALRTSPFVDVISRYFVGNEYQDRLSCTNLMVLPYRSNAYGLRVSRVVIEAVVSGMPVLVTAGTTLASQLQAFGAGECFVENDHFDLAAKVQTLATQFAEYQEKAHALKAAAAAHFSVQNFRNLLLKQLQQTKTE